MKNTFLPLIILIFLSFVAKSQDKLGIHVGIVQPIVTFSSNGTSSLVDNYALGFPVGITYRLSDKLAFDAEFVPFVNSAGQASLLVHPGMLFGLGSGFTLGTRAAFDVGQSSFGFTPLINKGFPISDNNKLFLELVLPLRFVTQYDGLQGQNIMNPQLSIGLHVGITF